MICLPFPLPLVAVRLLFRSSLPFSIWSLAVPFPQEKKSNQRQRESRKEQQATKGKTAEKPLRSWTLLLLFQRTESSPSQAGAFKKGLRGPTLQLLVLVQIQKGQQAIPSPFSKRLRKSLSSKRKRDFLDLLLYAPLSFQREKKRLSVHSFGENLLVTGTALCPSLPSAKLGSEALRPSLRARGSMALQRALSKRGHRGGELRSSPLVAGTVGERISPRDSLQPKAKGERATRFSLERISWFALYQSNEILSPTPPFFPFGNGRTEQTQLLFAPVPCSRRASQAFLLERISWGSMAAPGHRGGDSLPNFCSNEQRANKGRLIERPTRRERGLVGVGTKAALPVFPLVACCSFPLFRRRSWGAKLPKSFAPALWSNQRQRESRKEQLGRESPQEILSNQRQRGSMALQRAPSLQSHRGGREAYEGLLALSCSLFPQGLVGRPLEERPTRGFSSSERSSPPRWLCKEGALCKAIEPLARREGRRVRAGFAGPTPQLRLSRRERKGAESFSVGEAAL